MKKNLLYIFADQLHGFGLGCLGCKDASTPHLDALAKRGTVFENAYTSAPVCTPARITMWTGRNAGKLDALPNDSSIPQGVPTMASSFRSEGYQTSYVGKWHIGGAGNVPVPLAERAGFERFAGFQCYNEFRENVRFFDEGGAPIEFPGTHRTDATFSLAVRRLREAAADARPFLLCVSEQAPHYPCQPSEKFYAPFRGRQPSTRPNAIAGIDPYTPTYSPPSPPKESDPNFLSYGGDMTAYLRHYHAAVSQVDAGVGLLLAELERLGLSESTTVVFSSDHGDMQGSHGAINKSVPYEESTRIPLLFAGPGISSDLRRRELVSTVDFFPTFAELCGVHAPEGIDGTSFASCCSAETPELERAVFSEDQSGWQMLRRSRWKLVVATISRQVTHFFDLERDLFEMENLAAVQDCALPPEAANARSELLRELGDRA